MSGGYSGDTAIHEQSECEFVPDLRLSNDVKPGVCIDD